MLNDGTLVAAYSARIANSDFQPSSGVFVSTDDGATWVDRSDQAMRYYTKDVIIDPHDFHQNIWYAGVWGEWGSSNGKGGLYRTTDRGVTWTRITTNLKAVSSCTMHPIHTNEMYVTTEDQGLWYTANRQAAQPAFVQLNYPFRFPTRVFFNPYDVNEVWVTSYGNGLRLGRIEEPRPHLVDMDVTGEGATLRVSAAPGQSLLTEWTDDLGQGIWNQMDFQQVIEPLIELSDPSFSSSHIRLYRNRIE